jgi:hypothetical protein
MAIRTDFTAGEVLAAADLNDTFAAKLNLAGGKVLQVVEGTTSTGVTTTSTTPADTGLSATITPSSATSKILIIISQNTGFSTQGAAGGGEIRLLRGATVITTDLGFTSLYLQAAIPAGRSTIFYRYLASIVKLDSPNTTSAVTYKTQQRVESGGSSENISTQGNNATSVITLLEVSA